MYLIKKYNSIGKIKGYVTQRFCPKKESTS